MSNERIESHGYIGTTVYEAGMKFLNTQQLWELARKCKQEYHPGCTPCRAYLAAQVRT